MIKKAASVLIFLFLITCPQNAFADEFRKEVSATEILENLSMGEPIGIMDTVITGKLDISKAGLEYEEIGGIEKKVVRSKIYIVNSVFQDSVYLGHLYFEKPVDFHRTKFSGPVFFYESEFNEGVNFDVAHFIEKVDFSGVEFNDMAQFKGTNFYKRVSFDNATFRSRSWFSDAQFMGQAYFHSTKFNETDFSNSQFSDQADFQFARFDGKAKFPGVQFDDEALFNEAQFNGDVIFSRAQFKTINIWWYQLEGKFDYPGHGQFYLTLIKNFKALGRFEDADDAYYDYRSEKQRWKKWTDPTKYTDALLWVSCGYGVKPWNAVGFGGIVIVVFSFLYYRVGAIEERNTQKLNQKLRNRRERFTDAVYFSVTTFTTVGYGDWYPKGKYRYLAMMEGLLGWLIMALFLVTLGKVWIR